MSASRDLTWRFVVAGVALVLIRIAIVLLWSVAAGRAIHANLWVELGLTVLSVMIVAAAAGAATVYFGRRLSQDFRFDNIVVATTTFAVSTLALLLFAAVLPGEIVADTPSSVISVLTSHLVAVGTFSITIGLAAFLTVVALQRQHRRTRLFLIIQTLCVLGIWLATVLLEVGEAFKVISVVLLIVGGIVTLLNIRRLNWLATITLDKKIRLLWLCTCGAFAAVVLTSMLAFASESYLTQSTRMFLHSGTVVPAVLNLYGFLFFVRMFFATLVSLPNSGIVDRRSSEVDALAGITRLVAQTASVDDLLSSVTQYSLSVCRAHGAWCELYEGSSVRVVGPRLVTTEYVTNLHSDAELDNLLRSAKVPVHIDAMSEFGGATMQLSVIKSLIAIPLRSGTTSVGTLVMFSTIEYGFEQDDVNLLAAFGVTIGVGLEQARLLESALEKERLQREFEVARSIQVSLLPKESPPRSGWEIDATMIPAARVGGDYYDFVVFGNGNSGAIIADVSGKGVPAALYMATLKGVVLAECRNAMGPAELLRRINAALYGNMDRRTYISIAVAEFDPVSDLIRVARAGHTPALIKTASGIHSLSPPGIAIGLLPATRFDAMITEESIAVSDGDLCLLTTDGVTERRNSHLHELGIEALCKMMSSSVINRASQLVQETLRLLEYHAESTEPHDDITIVAMRVVSGDQTLQPISDMELTAGRI